MVNYILKTDKGDKNISLMLISAVRRWWKHVVLVCGLFATVAILLRSLLLGEIGAAPYSPSQQLLRQKKASRNVALRPIESRPDATEWSILERSDMEEDNYLKCDWEKERDIHDPETWIGMREAYISLVGTEHATLELDADRTFETAFLIPFEVQQSPGKGRGIFAKRDVSKGEVLYDFSKSAQFRKSSEFSEFLRILQPELACDVLMWSYVQYFGEKNGYSREKLVTEDLRIVTDLDPGSFCNSGNEEDGNMAWLDRKGDVVENENKADDPPYGKIVKKNGLVRQDAVKSAPLVATKDIQKGEELLCIYSQFSEGLGMMPE